MKKKIKNKGTDEKDYYLGGYVFFISISDLHIFIIEIFIIFKFI